MLRSASLAALALLAALVFGCGGGAASGDADPASAVPADALVYAEAVVRPGGDVKADAEDAARKVLRTDDPGARIRELIDRALRESGDDEIQFDRDIDPWLGDRVAVWVSGRAVTDDGGAVVLAAVTDPDAALDAVHKGHDADKQRLVKRSYEGVDYEVDEDGDAIGIVGDFLAAGAEPEFKRTIEASKGDSLAELDRYRQGVEDLADNRLGHFYADFKRAIELAMQQQPGGEDQLRQLQALVPLDKFPPIVGAFVANGERLAVDVSFRGSGGLGALGDLGAGGSTPLLADLPGDSWGAFGAAKYGQQLEALFGRYAGVFGGAAAKQQLKQQFGIDIEEDVLSWIGDVALFVRGDTVASLDGGVVIAVTDSDKAERGFAKLVGLLQSAGGVNAKPVSVPGAETAFAVRSESIPKPVILARSAEKVVIAYGSDAAQAALSPSSRLGDSDLFGRAKDVLEDMEPTLLLSMPSVLALVESAGAADADYEKARPYLEAYDVIALGAKIGGNGGRVRLAVGLK